MDIDAIDPDIGHEQKRLRLINHVYEMMYDPSAFSQFAHRLSELIDDKKAVLDVGFALEKSAKLAGRIGDVADVELSRDIGVLVLGLSRNNRVSHAPPSGEDWLGSKFVGDKNGIGWVDTDKKARNIAHVLHLDGHKHLPVHPILRDGIRSKTISKLIVVHQFMLTDGARGALKELYELTPAEIKLCVSLAEGHSLKEYARLAEVKVSTPRSQLKQIFLKVGVKSQAGLIRILTQISAASAIQEFSHKNRINLEPDWKNGLVSIQTDVCKTRYGTRLTYSKFGDPNGQPVLYFHHGLGARVHTKKMAEAAYRHNLLFFKFDRPGFGHSEILPNMSIKSIGHVTEDLIDHIGAERVHAIGYGVGARTLLDILPHTRGRIGQVTLYSFRGVFKTSGTTLMQKLSQFVWENPGAFMNFFKIMKLNASEKSMRKNLIKYYEDSPVDSKIMEAPVFVAERIKESEISTLQDFAGSLFDHKNLSAPLPDFGNPAYNIPIKAIFGSDDPFNNYADAETYLGQLPQCQVLLSQGDGQLHIDHDFDRFLKSAYLDIQHCPWLMEQSLS